MGFKGNNHQCVKELYNKPEFLDKFSQLHLPQQRRQDVFKVLSSWFWEMQHWREEREPRCVYKFPYVCIIGHFLYQVLFVSIKILQYFLYNVFVGSSFPDQWHICDDWKYDLDHSGLDQQCCF